MRRRTLLIWLLIIYICCMGMSVEAKTLTRYTTKTVALKEKANTKAKTVYKLKQNTKLTITKQWKIWARVSYKGEMLYVKKAELHTTKAVNKWKGKSFKGRGRGRWNGCSWTWYTTRQYPDRKNSLGIKGKHADKRGFICDKDGYICLASGRGNKKKHAIVPTPFGKYGKVYDTNGGYNNHWFDAYVNW